MFKIIPKEEMITKIESSMEVELKDMVMMFPDLKEKIIKNMLWGIFSKEFIYSGKEKENGRYDYVTNFSYKIIELAENELKKSGETVVKFFDDKVKDIIKNKSVSVFLDYKDSDVLIEDSEKTKDIKEQDLIIAITLPDSGVVFEDYIEGHWFEDKNQWIIEYMDKYDHVKHELMQKFYNYFVQIGGHGRWIQNDYNGSYVAQLNMDIGDCGSIFIEARDEEIKGYVDMY